MMLVTPHLSIPKCRLHGNGDVDWHMSMVGILVLHERCMEPDFEYSVL